MSAAKLQKIVLVKSGDQIFGLSVFAVRDMVKAQALLPIPLAPKTVAGVLNLRGKLVTALRLHVLLGLPAGEENIMVIVENEQELSALIVDTVTDIISIKPDVIHKPSALLDTKLRSMVSGTITQGGQSIHLLDITRLTA